MVQGPVSAGFFRLDSLRARSSGLFLAKNSCEKRILGREVGASLTIALRKISLNHANFTLNYASLTLNYTSLTLSHSNLGSEWLK